MTIKETMTMLFPSLSEVAMCEHKDDKTKLGALMKKVSKRLNSVGKQLQKRAMIDLGESGAAYCMTYFYYAKNEVQDEIYNLILNDYHRIMELVEEARENKSTSRRERRQRRRNIELLEHDLMLLDVIDSKRETLLDIEMLSVKGEKVQTIHKQLLTLEILIGIAAICTEDINAELMYKVKGLEQCLRQVEWHHREGSLEHLQMFNIPKLDTAVRDYDMELCKLVEKAQVTNANKLIRVVKVAIGGELTARTPFQITDLYENKRELIQSLYYL